MEAYKICEKINLIPPVVEQINYNMIFRDFVEREYNDLFKKYGMGTTIWSPLENGILTGKYINEIPEGSKFSLTNDNAKNANEFYQGENNKILDEKII